MDIHDGEEWMLPWTPAGGLMENFRLCQVKQGRSRELQRPAESTGAHELLRKTRNLLKTLPWHFCFLPVCLMSSAGDLLPGVRKVSAYRQFHLRPQRKHWRLMASWPLLEPPVPLVWLTTASQQCASQQLPKALHSASNPLSTDPAEMMLPCASVLLCTLKCSPLLKFSLLTGFKCPLVLFYYRYCVHLGQVPSMCAGILVSASWWTHWCLRLRWQPTVSEGLWKRALP